MGISVQQFRNRIGTYNLVYCIKTSQNLVKLKSKKQNGTVPRKQKSSLSCLTILVVCLTLLCQKTNTLNLSSVEVNLSSSSNVKSFPPVSQHIINHNFLAKITFGNRRKNGIKICQWNAGGGFLSNKKAELHNIIDEFKPHVLGVTESCFKISHDIENVIITGHKLFLSKTLENPSLGVSRA